MAFPATYNIQYYRGDTFQFIINPKSADGTAFDLSGFNPTGIFGIATARGVAPVASGTAAVSGNSVVCTIPPAVGDRLNGGTIYYYDVQVTDPDAPGGVPLVYTLVTGIITVTNDISGR